jgi:hypothetical protein
MLLSPNSLVLKILAIWNACRGAWMAYIVFLLSRALALAGDPGPYGGIGVDRILILKIGAMPPKLLGILAGFDFGRVGELAVEFVAAVLYFTVAIGMWRRMKGIRLIAVGLGLLDSLLLVFYLRFAIPSPILPEFRPLALLCWSVFLGIYSVNTIFLLRPSIKAFFMDNVALAG